MKRSTKVAAAAFSACMLTMSTQVPAQAQGLGITNVLTPVNQLLAGIPQPAEDIAPPVPAPLADIGLTGTRITAPFHQEAGPIRQTFGHFGPHQVASTITTTDCTPIYAAYNQLLRFNHGNNVTPPCYGVAPEGPNPAVGYQFIYPSDLKPGERAPMILLSPGIGTEPGMVHPHAEMYASNGYIVVLGYTAANWFGAQLDIAALAAHMADQDQQHPLYERFDFSNIVLAGHSAGGGAALRMAEKIGPLLQQAGRADAQVKAVVGINPGPADFGLASPASTVPTVVLAAEHESLVPWPLSKAAYDRAQGQKWWGIVKGAEHGVYLDGPNVSVYDAIVVSLADYATKHTAAATAVYEGGGFLNDPEMMQQTSS